MESKQQPDDSQPNVISDLRKRVVEGLRTVIDPELGVNIVDLGLLYQIHLDENHLQVQFTTTTPGCPMRRYLMQQVEKVLGSISEIDSSQAEMIMDPPWSVEMIKEGVEFFSVPPPHAAQSM